MLTKLATYSTMLELRTFTLQSLAEGAGVRPLSGQTVLSRLRKEHPDALDVRPLDEGQYSTRPGKPTYVYSLTQQGEQAVRRYLAPWAGVTSFKVGDTRSAETQVHDDDAAGGPPPGLLLAEASLKELTVSSEDTADLAKSIRRNLKWAENELVDHAYDFRFRSRIALVSELLNAWERQHGESDNPTYGGEVRDDIWPSLRDHSRLGIPAVQVVALGAREAAQEAIAEFSSLFELSITQSKFYRDAMLEHAISRSHGSRFRRWELKRNGVYRREACVEFLLIDSSNRSDLWGPDLHSWLHESRQCTRVVLDQSPSPLEEIRRIGGVSYLFGVDGFSSWAQVMFELSYQWLVTAHRDIGASRRTELEQMLLQQQQQRLEY